jgi:mevalonate kinase
MEKWVNTVLIIMMATSAAISVALALAYIARYELGLSRQAIRTQALLGAAVLDGPFER